MWQPTWSPGSLVILTTWHSSLCRPQVPQQAGLNCITSMTLWKETWFSAGWFSQNTQSHGDLGEA